MERKSATKHICTLLLTFTACLWAKAEGRVYLYGEPGAYRYGMLNHVAANGRWVVGCDDGNQSGAYIIDTQQPDKLIEVPGGELYAITNDGMAVGAWYDNQGTASEPINYAHAAIYSNGTWTRLDEPSNTVGQSYARAVAPDGSHIAGMVFCHAKDSDMGGKFYPALWTRNGLEAPKHRSIATQQPRSPEASQPNYTLTIYNDIALPGNMGFFVNDISADGSTIVGSVCTDAGGTVPAMIRNGELLCWNKMEWKEWKFGSTYYEAGFVDGILEGAQGDDWFTGAFNRICGDYVFGHRSVASNVDQEKATGTLNHFRTIYKLSTGEFSDTPSDSYFTYGFTPDNAFIVTGTTAYLANHGGLTRIIDSFDNLDKVDNFDNVNIACVYSCDESRRVFACSTVWFNEVIGDYCESPALIMLDKPLSLDEPSIQATGTATAPRYTLTPDNQTPLRTVNGIYSVTFSSLEQLYIKKTSVTVSDDEGNYDYATLSLGDQPNQIKLQVEGFSDRQGQWQFTIPAGSLIDRDSGKYLPELTFAYSVEPYSEVHYSVTPSLDQPIPQLEGDYTVTLSDYPGVQWSSSVRPCRVLIYKADDDTNGRARAFYDATTKGNSIMFTAKPRLYEAGDYILLLSEFVRSDNRLDIPAISIPFTLTGGTPEEEDDKNKLDQRYTLSPDPSLPIYQLSGKVVITFPGIPAFADVGGFPTITTPSGKQYGLYADGTVLRVKMQDSYDGSSYVRNAGYIDLDAVGLKFTEPGDYTFSIPKNVFHVDGEYDKAYVDPFEFTYTITTPQTVLFEEDFNGDYSDSFPHTYEGDGLMPNETVASLFFSSVNNQYMPWWVLRESASTPDRFIASHSCYTEPGTSDDWLVSRAIPLPEGDGLMLAFDARSYLLRDGERLSDLLVGLRDFDNFDNFEASTLRGFEASELRGFEAIPNDWTHYTIPLDEWAGRTICICFINRNTDRDLLCIDKVRIYRNEAVEVTLDPLPTHIADDSFTVQATVKPTAATLSKYRAEFVLNGVSQSVDDTPVIEQGGEHTFSATFGIEPLATANIVFRLTPEDDKAIERSTSTTRLAFKPHKRVLLEESTGVWCGNCPIAIYNIESLKTDEAIADDLLPVSIHISGSSADLMTLDAYADYLGLAGVAPMARLDRGADALGFTAAYDANYDPTQYNSFANAVFAQRERLPLLDIEVEAQPVLNGNDTVAFNCTARVRPAVPLSASRYRVGFILTENNVGVAQRAYWAQHNYFSGYPFESQLGGWSLLPDPVPDVRYHYVARSLPYPGGKEGSFIAGSTLEAEQEYSITATIDIPDTYLTDRNGTLASHPVRPYNCEVTAYIVDTRDLSIQNAARTPITPQALDLYTISDLIADGIQTPNSQLSSEHSSSERQRRTLNSQLPTVYDLQGRRVNKPAAGLYISNKKKMLLKQY